FIRIILRHGRGVGLYGRCKAYFGTVEAQGKETLHLHLLLWLEGHLSPQDLRDKISTSEFYKKKVLKWLESIIMTGFPSSNSEHLIYADRMTRVRHTDMGNPHPGTLMSPLILQFTHTFWTEFQEDVTSLLYKYNWHEHQATCWKYLKRGQEKKDANCRLRMDGVTRSVSDVDPQTYAIQLRRLHPWLASYTDVVTFLLRCNMEIKFVGSGEAAKVFLYYVTDYITKPSLPVHAGMAALSYALKKLSEKAESGTISSAVSAVMTAVNSMMGRQEISHPQVMSYLIGGGDHYTSESFVTLQWGSILRFVE
ncbi:hypothetical protein CPB83DRAFT_748463, partial [Crepidotus variabilis]